MENEYLLDMSTETISPPSLPKDHSPSNFSRNLIGHFKVYIQGRETLINDETPRHQL